MSRPFFSVIIPAYNAAETLEDCLESVWEQSFSAYEIILVNDGSQDATASIAKDWRKGKPGLRMRIINQRNEGLGSARNAAIMDASGTYCALLDADDLWHPEKLASCHQILAQEEPPKVIYHKVENFGRGVDHPRSTFPLQGLTDLIEKGCPLVPSATLIETTLAQTHPFQIDEDFHGAEDLYLWLELLVAGHALIYWPEALSYYREEGGMSSRIDEHLRNVLNVYDHFYRLNRINKKDYEMATQRKYYEAARFYQKRGNHHQAHHFYSVADSKSLKILGLKILNRLGITI